MKSQLDSQDKKLDSQSKKLDAQDKKLDSQSKILKDITQGSFAVDHSYINFDADTDYSQFLFLIISVRSLGFLPWCLELVHFTGLTKLKRM